MHAPLFIVDLFFAALILVAGVLAFGLWFRHRANRYAVIRRTEQIRLQIGLARCRLVEAVAQGKLSPDSATFKDVYFVQTAMMRHTGEYREFSDAHWERVLKQESRRESVMRKEATTWPPEVTAIVHQTSDALRQVWIGFMPCGTVLRVMKHLLVKIGLMSYDRVETMCDRWLLTLIKFLDALVLLVGKLTFAHMNSIPYGMDVRAAASMRQTEMILRSVSKRAA